MPTISHHTLGGRVSALTSPAFGRADLLPDALGSAVRTAVGGAAVGHTAQFLGYGSALYSPWLWFLPRGAWKGAWGYRRTDLRHAEQYLRARHLSTTEGRFTAADPLWPYESAYGYVGGNPTGRADPSGMQAGIIGLPFRNNLITIRFGAFIHSRFGYWYRGRNWINVGDPSHVYASDGRGPIFGGTSAPGTYRVFSEAIIDPQYLGTRKAIIKSESAFGLSTSGKTLWTTMDQSGHPLWFTDTRQSVPKVNLVALDEGRGRSICFNIITFSVSVTNPFKPVLFDYLADQDIDYTVIFIVERISSRFLRVEVSGYHDQFPDYEVITSFGKSTMYYYPAPDWIGGLGKMAPPPSDDPQ